MRLYNVHSCVPAVATNKTWPPSGFVPNKQSDGFEEWNNVRRSLRPVRKSLAYERYAISHRHEAIRDQGTGDWSSPTTTTTETTDNAQNTPPPTRGSPYQIIRRIQDENVLDTLPALRDLDDILKRARALARELDDDISDTSSLTAISDLGTKVSSDAALTSDDYLVDWDDILPSTFFQGALRIPLGDVGELHWSSKPSPGVPLDKTAPSRELVYCPTDQLNDQIIMSKKQFSTKNLVNDTSSKVTANYAAVRANLRKVGGYKYSPTAVDPETVDFANQGQVRTHEVTRHRFSESPRKLSPERKGHDFHSFETQNNPTSEVDFDRALTPPRPLNEALRSGQKVFHTSPARTTPDTSNLSSQWTNVVDNSFPTDDSRKTLFPSPSPLKGTALEEKDEGQVSIRRGSEFAKHFATLHAGIRQLSADNQIQEDQRNSEVLEAIAPAASLETNPRDDPQYAKYFRMIRMGLPIGAVKNSMAMAGYDSSILHADTASAVPLQTLKSDTLRRFRIHWEENRHAGSNTVWAMAKDDPDINIQMDQAEVDRLFRSEMASHAPSATPRDREQTAVKVIDTKRANNGGIALARIKIPYGEIARAIDHFDQDAITSEQIRAIMNFLPTKDERVALRSYMMQSGSSINVLCECEKFMIAMAGVEHAKRKLSAIRFMQSFEACLEDLQSDARMVQKACDEITGSSRLRKVLGIILSIGNRLNQAGTNGKDPVKAITLDALLKLNQAKTFDRQTTFLHFVVSSIRRTKASLMNFKDDIPSICKVDKTQLSLVMLEMERMEKGLDEVRKIAVQYSLIFAGLSEDDAASVSGTAMPLDCEVKLLQTTSVGRFTLDACVRMTVLVNDTAKSRNKVLDLFQYFGEESKTATQPDMVFHCLRTFVKDFDRALNEVIVQEEASARETRGVPVVRDATKSFDDGDTNCQKRCGSGIFAAISEIKKKKSKARLVRWRRGGA